MVSSVLLKTKKTRDTLEPIYLTWSFIKFMFNHVYILRTNILFISYRVLIIRWLYCMVSQIKNNNVSFEDFNINYHWHHSLCYWIC